MYKNEITYDHEYKGTSQYFNYVTSHVPCNDAKSIFVCYYEKKNIINKIESLS